MAKKKGVGQGVGGGQPTKYREEYCQQLIDFMSKGYPYEAFAGEIKVCRDTLYEWEKVHQKFSDAKKVAVSAAYKAFMDKGHLLMQGAYGRAGNPTPWVFMMKNIFGWRDNRDIKIEGETKSKLIIQMGDDDDAESEE